MDSFLCEWRKLTLVRFEGREDGISEVVSAILIVAVAVILAAIVASLVFGVGMPEDPKIIAVTATRSGDNITFMNHGGVGMDRVVEIRCWIGGVESTNDNFTLNKVGASETRIVPETTRVVVIGQFVDSEPWIVLDKTL